MWRADLIDEYFLGDPVDDSDAKLSNDEVKTRPTKSSLRSLV